jgi:hypothetical protein
MKRTLAAIVIAFSLTVVGCGAGFVAGKPWNAEIEGSVFDDGVDLVDDPAKLSGEWEASARRALEVRSSVADLTAVVKITSIQTTKNVDGQEARRITVEIAETLYGKAPDPSIALESAASALGNSLITRHESRLTGSFIAFVRWFDREDGSIGSHFHFSPSSPAVSKIVRGQIQTRVKQEIASGK